jgi:hypothetical protein
MGLNEFINKNKEFSNPRSEWEKSRQLIRSIEKSGAIQLLESLGNSISSNPRFESSTKLEKFLFVEDRDGIISFSKSEHLGLYFDVKSKRNDSLWDYRKLEAVPCALVKLDYNMFRKTVQLWGSFYPQGGSMTLDGADSLEIETFNPDILNLKLRIDRRREDGHEHVDDIVETISLSKQEWMREGMVDRVLGELYSKNPAKKSF